MLTRPADNIGDGAKRENVKRDGFFSGEMEKVADAKRILKRRDGGGQIGKNSGKFSHQSLILLLTNLCHGTIKFLESGEAS